MQSSGRISEAECGEERGVGGGRADQRRPPVPQTPPLYCSPVESGRDSGGIEATPVSGHSRPPADP